MYSSHYISIDDEKLHYLRMGMGKRLLIAFHGYGNDAASFAVFERYLGNDCTIISIDLPYHGASKWHTDRQLTKKMLVQLVNALRLEAGADKVSLLGYSIGGRICLCITEQMPEVLDRVLLIAPDGLVFSRFYHFVTKTTIGKWIFKNLLAHPKPYFAIIEFLRKIRLLNRSLYHFVKYYIGTENSRTFLINVWPCFKDIVPDADKLKAAIKQYDLPVHIFMGAQDHVIPPVFAERFKKGLASVHLYVLNKGHKVLDDDTAPQMAACLLN